MEKTSREYAENLAWETYPDNSLNIERAVFVSTWMKAVEETNAKELLEALIRIKILYMDYQISEYKEPYKQAWIEVNIAINKAIK